MGEPGPRISIYDTTLRDGSQGEGVLLSLEDKLHIAKRLDDLGVDFIEGGWPGANPKDSAFFQKARHLDFKSRLTAFGSTRRFGIRVEEDPTLQGLLQAQTATVTIFGKAWDLHVREALGITEGENLDLIRDSIEFLKSRVDTVLFDAEHFFDGFKDHPEYALSVLNAAREGGADLIVLCDTNGGTMVAELSEIFSKTFAAIGSMPMGIHCHNDCGLAVANSLAAVSLGAVQVQGTVNGIGERCGNANLMTVIPNLMLKMGMTTGIKVRQLRTLSRFVDERINRSPRRDQPFVGMSAFAHKGGIHVSAILKDGRTYEHIDPEQVGNQRRILISEQAGRSNLVAKLADYGIEGVEGSDPRLKELLGEIKDLEHQGYQFDGAEASFELRARRALGQVPVYFETEGFRVIDERRSRGGLEMGAEATVKVKVGTAQLHLVGEGAGPVDALHTALLKALEGFYPEIEHMKLVDYKVRILQGEGTKAKVRVAIEWQDKVRQWSTVGVSDHIIAASYDAMVEAVNYKLFKDNTPSVQ
ncbi:MAG: citramalate synthase [Magnetococcales bacterium]|nr:citramalate synthase [Magnetococcales bacterium]MBF0149631.1 citramalate synthase [Magnetococcales bacterium]MBF0172477.1 citramalate synthase [Magnetococcales bacterium]MBF0632097.1 citramalate synthase [Magnetococcales bacterium]